MYRDSREAVYLSFVKMSVIVWLSLLLILEFADVVAAVAEEQKSTRQTVDPNLMWISAVAAGCGLIVLTVAVLLTSTFLLRRYERKRMMILAPMMARLQSPPESADPRQMTGPAGAPAASPVGSDGPPAVSSAQPLGVGHVYYNRGLDVDETEHEEATQHLDPRPIEIVGSRRASAGKILETSDL